MIGVGVRRGVGESLSGLGDSGGGVHGPGRSVSRRTRSIDRCQSSRGPWDCGEGSFDSLSEMGVGIGTSLVSSELGPDKRKRLFLGPKHRSSGQQE